MSHSAKICRIFQLESGSSRAHPSRSGRRCMADQILLPENQKKLGNKIKYLLCIFKEQLLRAQDCPDAFEFLKNRALCCASLQLREPKCLEGNHSKTKIQVCCTLGPTTLLFYSGLVCFQRSIVVFCKLILFRPRLTIRKSDQRVRRRCLSH